MTPISPAALLTPALCGCFPPGCGKLPHLLLRQPDPLRDMQVPLQRSQLGAVQVFSDLPRWKRNPFGKALATDGSAERRRKEIYLALHPDTRQHSAGGHGKAGSASDNLSFAEDTASRIGKDRRTVERDAARGERIADEVLEEVRGTEFDKGVVLDELASTPRDTQAASASLFSRNKIRCYLSRQIGWAGWRWLSSTYSEGAVSSAKQLMLLPQQRWRLRRLKSSGWSSSKPRLTWPQSKRSWAILR